MTDINDTLGVAYSLKKAIEDTLLIDTHLHYNGMPTPKTLPHVIIKQMLSPISYVSKARETVAIDMNFEVTIYSNSLSESTAEADALRNLLIFGDFTYYDRLGAKQGDNTFSVEVENVYAPEFTDITDETRRHAVYFMIRVGGTLHKY